MKEPQAPTLEELLAEFEKISSHGEGKTTTEWAQTWTCGQQRAIRLIAWAIQNGRMRTTSVLRASVTRPGYRCRIHVHEFIPKTKKAGRRGSR